MKSKMSKACDISTATRKAVKERDGLWCIFCGESYNLQLAHYVSRSQHGLGIEQNLVTLCINCHHALDNGVNTELRLEIKAFIKDYLQSHYSDWCRENLIYKKWRD